MTDEYKNITTFELKAAKSFWQEYADEMSEDLVNELQEEFLPKYYPIQFMHEEVKEFQKAIKEGDTCELRSLAFNYANKLKNIIKEREKESK